jgi:AcrR family transcriptional regulator
MYEMSTSKGGAYHHGDLRGALIALALEALEKAGPETLALRALAQQAGVSGMAPYRHFADKAALLEAVARQGFAQLHEEMREVDDEEDPKKALVAFGVAYVRFACARPGLFRLMFGGAPPTPTDRLAGDPQTVYGLFAVRIAQLVPPRRRQIAFLACWATVHGLATLIVGGRIREPTPAPADLAERIGAMMIKGIL